MPPSEQMAHRCRSPCSTRHELGNLDDSGSLTTADALGLAGDADGAAADADLHEVCASLSEEAEALGVHHVAGTYLDRVAVFFPDIGCGTRWGFINDVLKTMLKSLFLITNRQIIVV